MSRQGMTPLTEAAFHGHKAMVELLLRHGAAIEGSTSASSSDGSRPYLTGETALHIAARRGFGGVVETLLAHHASVKAVNTTGLTPLHAAASVGQERVVEQLLHDGANPNAETQDGDTPLNFAAQVHNPECVRFLLAAGAKPGVKNKNFRAPLSFAAEGDSIDCVKLLLDAKADVNGDPHDQPLLWAVIRQDQALAGLLLQNGANANIVGRIALPQHQNLQILNQSKQGLTPLWLAVKTDNFPLVQLLLNCHADPNERKISDEPLGLSALQNTNILRALLEAGEKPDDRTPSNYGFGANLTLLEIAVERNLTDGAALLLNAGANANEAEHGTTPLNRAALYCRDQMSRVANDPMSAETPFLLNRRIFEMLLEHHADPNRMNAGGDTPLKTIMNARAATEFHRSLDRGHPERAIAAANKIIELLQKSGGIENPPVWNAIRISRPTTGFSAGVFVNGTNDWNRYTLLELLFNFYFKPQSHDVVQLPFQLTASGQDKSMPFPDLAHIAVVRPSHDSTNVTRIQVNLLSWPNDLDATNSPVNRPPPTTPRDSINGSADVILEFGDVVEIPARDHPAGETVVGLSDREREAITRKILKTVEFVTRNDRMKFSCYPIGGQATLNFVIAREDVRRLLETSSPDLSRVKVKRTDSKTGRVGEWVLDCRAGRQADDFWLENGDVIEVPEKP